MSQFIQITCTAKSNLFALDNQSDVWHYIPYRPGLENRGKGRFAFWSKLTSYRRDSSAKDSTAKRQLGKQADESGFSLSD